MESHIRKVHACLAVICHLHIWQNDQDLLSATAGTQGRNAYQNKSQHTKLTLDKKISCRSCMDSYPQHFSHDYDALTTKLSPLNCVLLVWCRQVVLSSVLTVSLICQVMAGLNRLFCSLQMVTRHWRVLITFDNVDHITWKEVVWPNEWFVFS